MSHESSLLQHLFGRPDIASVTDEQLSAMIGQYPYFAHLRWFRALKASRSGDQKDDALSEAALFTSWPLRILQLLEPAAPPARDADGKPEETSAGIENQQEENKDHKETTKPVKQDLVPDETSLIQPLFTRDYFAYTGQKLPEQIEDDKRPTMEQLHSFTGWLRTLKNHQGTGDPDLMEDEASLAARAENEDIDIRKKAEESLKTEDDVLTEAMAEVRMNKGQVDKAIAIYEKLSLSNPEKSAYFAQKIADLKNN